ncbi:MAG: DUF4406 domain-containing protein [Anaerolineae bacterium]|nr:DUF4406 domain-containing protein [Anaerolineae bacterium]
MAGPLHTSGWIWDNMRAALRARLELVRSGLCVVYTPHLDAYTATLELTDEAVWMRHCLDAVRLSDAVYRLPGKSRGSDEETNLADRLEIPVFRDAETLMLWLQTVGEGSDG